MKGMIIIAAAASLIAGGALAQASRSAPTPTGTVNSYSPNELQRARTAAQRQGFTPRSDVWAQAGAIFMYASKGGDSYQLTITPEGQVYASPPAPPNHPAFFADAGRAS